MGSNVNIVSRKDSIPCFIAYFKTKAIYCEMFLVTFFILELYISPPSSKQPAKH
jgi:hypothetical protein